VLLTFLGVFSPSSSILALADQPQAEPQKSLHDYLDQEEARRDKYRADGGNDAVHKTWSHLRDLEPAWKETYSSIVPTDLVGTVWHYTKALLRALFMNGPSNDHSSDRSRALRPGLRKAVDDLESSAAQEDLDAIYLLAEMNMHGNFTHPRDPERALHWYTQLAELEGNSTAQSMLGLLYATGIGGVPRDQARALLYHHFAAEHGDVRSEMTLAFRYHSGIGTPRDCNKAVSYYKRVADKAMDYWRSGPPGGLQLSRNAYRWVETNGGAYGEGASHSSSGPNGRRDHHAHSSFEDILEYLILGEKSGDFSATFTIGKHYYDPPRGYRRNLRAAQRQFMKVARLAWGKDGKIKSNAPEGIEKWAGKAAAYLGRMSLRGEGMEQNFEKAGTWFHRGVAYGDPFAQYHLGLMYRDGLGVPQDGAKAGSFLQASAEQGYAPAQSALGVLFMDQGDIDTAGRYFELAASAGIM
jgi:SEL1 protein